MFKNFNKIGKQLNWRLNFSCFFIVIMGLLSLASTKPELFYKQLLWCFLGLVLAFLILRFDWRPLINYFGAFFGLYLFIVLVLLATYFLAQPVRGVRAWLGVGFFQFQPSEFAKIILIIILAGFFRKKHISIARVSNLFISFIYFFIPAFLIALQPDLGSVLVLFSIWFGFLLVSGIPWRRLSVALMIFLIVGIIMWTNVLKDFQKERILGVFFPERDPLGINYSVIQSKIAIGSAGFFGKGFGQGTQVQLGFLPEAQTDFIFAAVVEEFGLIAGFFVLLSFLVLIFEIIKIGFRTENNFNRFICLGTVILFSIQLILNIGSSLGLSPVIGVTFPFLSYGGSSLLTNFILIGIIQSIAIRIR